MADSRMSTSIQRSADLGLGGESPDCTIRDEVDEMRREGRTL